MSLDKPNWANKCKATLGCGIRNKCSWNLRGWVQLTSTIQHIIKIGHDFTEVWNLKGQNLIFKSVLLRVSGPALGVCCAGPWFLSINSTNNHDTRQHIDNAIKDCTAYYEGNQNSYRASLASQQWTCGELPSCFQTVAQIKHRCHPSRWIQICCHPLREQSKPVTKKETSQARNYNTTHIRALLWQHNNNYMYALRSHCP